MNFFAAYKPFYKSNLRLALPVILSQMGQITVQLADTAMVGRYGGDDPTPLAAVAFGTSIFFIIFVAAMGLSFGLTPLVGEYFAKDDKRYAAELLQNGAALFMLTGMAASALLVAARPMLSLLGGIMIDSGSDASIAEVIDAALPYYDILVWSVFPAMIFFTFKQFLEGIGNTRTAMVVIIVCNAINIVFNWMLIFGKCGFEPMGAVGAGIATLISRICMCAMIAVYFFRSRRFRVYVEALRMKAFRLRTMLRILKVGIPISFQMFMEASIFVVANIMVLAFGAHALSAYQIGTNMMNITFMIVVAIGSATTILCSHIYGQGNFDSLRRTVNASYQLGLAWCSTAAICFVLLRFTIPALFTTNARVIELTGTMLVYIALFQVSDCLQTVSISIMRGLQDVKVIMPIVFVSYILINLPVGYLLAFKCGFEAVGLVMGFIAGLSCCAVMTVRRVRRDIARLEAQTR